MGAMLGVFSKVQYRYLLYKYQFTSKTEFGLQLGGSRRRADSCEGSSWVQQTGIAYTRGERWERELKPARRTVALQS